MDIEKKLQEKIARNQILIDEPMSNHTSFRIGGNADFYVKVKNIDELKHALNVAKTNNIPFNYNMNCKIMSRDIIKKHNLFFW